MILTERHNITGSPEIIRLCRVSKELYNQCNFLMRKTFFLGQRTPSFGELHRAVRHLDCFEQLHNTKTATQTVRQAIIDWTNFFKSLIAYGKNKKLYLKCPKPPNYKKKLAKVIYFNDTIRKGPLKINKLVPTNDIFQINSKHCHDFRQVIITPKSFGFIIEVTYKLEEKEKAEKPRKGICCVDTGVNNLMAITSDKHTPILVNGRILKNINQHYNKNQTKRNLRKRYWRLENYFHHASKLIIDNCTRYGIGTIIIGRNTGWKFRCKFSKKSQQNFQSIPFHLLFEKIKYKAELVGIDVTFTEEAYTSQASFLDRDSIPAFEHGVKPPIFSGKRDRGLYKLANRTLNADVNGSANIGRKVIQNEEILLRLDRSLVARPVRINPLKSFSRNNGEKPVDTSNLQI